MAGLGVRPQPKRLDKNRYRRIELGLRSLTPKAEPVRPHYRRNIALMVILCLAVALTTRALNTETTYIVKVDGNPIGATQDRETFSEIVARLSESEAARIGAEVRLCNKIALESARRNEAVTLLTEDELADAFRGCLSFTAQGYVISVNGNEVVALSSEEEARGVVSDLRGSYIRAITASGHVTVEDVFIREDVGIKEKEVPSAIFRKRDEAVRILNRGTDKIMSYIVQRGDSLWSIAQANHLSVPDLLKANPEVDDGDFIKEGQNLNLVVPDPYVTLASTETVTFSVAIPYTVEVSYDPEMWPWKETVTQYGESGEKEITQEVTRENGREVSRTTLRERIVSYPVTHKVIRGSRQVPPMGSGQMAWPLQGQITSYYGWRWGSFHHGIDIGADHGSPIIAADAGMVSFAGWNGGYGYLVRIDHGGGKETWYGHMSRFAVGVGDKVAKGDTIGYVGSTGISTGPHLHFEVRIDGDSENPMSFYK